MSMVCISDHSHKRNPDQSWTPGRKPKIPPEIVQRVKVKVDEKAKDPRGAYTKAEVRDLVQDELKKQNAENLNPNKKFTMPTNETIDAAMKQAGIKVYSCDALSLFHL